MIVLRALKNLEFLRHLPAERILGEHALDRLDDGFVGILLEEQRILLLLEPAHIPRVIGIKLFLRLVARELHLVGIDDDHEIAYVGVGRVLGLSLALEHRRDLAREPAERNVGSVDDVPITLVFLVAELIIGGLGIYGFCH